MDAVDVVSAYYLSAETLEIVGCALHGGVHIVGTVLPVKQFGVGVVQRLLAQSLGIGNLEGRNRYQPCMALHATLVALVDGEGQRVVAGVLVVAAGQCTVPRLYGRGIYYCTACARLQIHGIDTILLQAVQDVAKFLLLFLPAFLGHRPCLGPVKSHYGGKPYGTHLVFGHGTSGHAP